MKNVKQHLPFIAAIVLVAVVSFYGGYKYGGNNGGFSAVPTPDGARQRFAGNMPGGANQQNRRGLSNQANGDIIAQDDKSLTIKLHDGGSKIVFLSDTTAYLKIASTTAASLKVGDSVMVSGKSNADGSLTAVSVQLRPSTSTTPPFARKIFL